jgi:hypothetical protein
MSSIGSLHPGNAQRLALSSTSAPPHRRVTEGMPEHGSLRQANVVWAAANPDAAPPQIRLDLPAPERYRPLVRVSLLLLINTKAKIRSRLVIERDWISPLGSALARPLHPFLHLYEHPEWKRRRRPRPATGWRDGGAVV